MAESFYEFIKVAFNMGKVVENLASKVDPNTFGEAAGRGAGKEIYEKASKAHGKDVAGLGIGALAGKALARRGSLGALLGLAAARHKDIGEAAKQGYGKAKKAIS
jgi:hypothetical protein